MRMPSDPNHLPQQSNSTPLASSLPSSSTPPTSVQQPASKLRLRDRYSSSLRVLSARTGTPLPSLITSFAILHELTAIIPFVGIFYGCRVSGLGESAAGAAVRYAERRRERDPDVWVARWMDEGERWAERVGRRYGIFGYPKGPRNASSEEGERGGMSVLAGDGANALVAYCLTKVRRPFCLTSSYQ